MYQHHLQLVRLGIDTQQAFVLFMHADCFICKSEGFETQTQIMVTLKQDTIIATLHIVRSTILQACEVSLSESAWARLNAHPGDSVTLSHVPPVTSFGYVRSKLYGHPLNAAQWDAIMRDVVDGKYTNIHLSSLITTCGHNNLSVEEITHLTRAMIKTGTQLHWDQPVVMDKHCVGGIPGNRTTPIVVAIVAAAGLILPKTSSRAITSPSGTADTVETMTSVCLNAQQIQAIIAQEGGCMSWGGALGISPADDILIRVERVLDLDPHGQMIASVLSKKIAVGATHVLIDIPVGPTAKIRSDFEFLRLQTSFSIVGRALNIHVYALKTDGRQPIGHGIGPALEAKDCLAVLRGDLKAPMDLKDKALALAAIMLELGNKAAVGEGLKLATTLLESGRAYQKFLAICHAQGGFKEPLTAPLCCDIVATTSGFVTKIDNRNLAKIAKLAGAPHDATAGITFFASLGTRVEKGQVLYQIHAESSGTLAYSRDYALSMPHLITIDDNHPNK